MSDCFKNENSLETKSNEWFKTLNGYFHQCFKKIRCKKTGRETDTDKLMRLRTELIQKAKIEKEEKREDIMLEISRVEQDISTDIAEKNRIKVVENLKVLSNVDGTTNTNGVWGIMRKVFPKSMETLPFAKKDFDGNIISSQYQLKLLYLNTFKSRLRHRPIKAGLEDIKLMKDELCHKRLEIANGNKSDPWKLENLMKVLGALKKDKSRDPHGMLNELFKPGVAGIDFQESFLMLANGIKKDIFIPKFVQYANIVSIYKGKGEKMNLDNDRGIFIVNLFRSMIMKMVYDDKYALVDGNMSDSNVGARRNKNIRNHIFILNGIITEVITNKSSSIDIEILDYRQCFDSMWLEESMNDLWEAGIQDNNLALIYKMNDEVQVAVKTPFGLTERTTINKIVMQGETFGPLCCSVQVDSFGKECLKEGKLLYWYKERVGVPPLAMIDDLVCISKCGINSVKMNSFINSKSNLKKLQFGLSKCHVMHVGIQKSYCPELKLDEWDIKSVEDINTGEKMQVDEFLGASRLESTDSEKYLGDIISKNGSNTKNIESRRTKGIGIVNQIMSKLEGTIFGPYYFEVGLILRGSNLINGILTNAEAWYGMKTSEIEQLEMVDEMMLRRFLEAGKCTPKEMLHLETGTLPLRFIIRVRRLMYFHYLLNEEENSLVNQFLRIQMKNPSKEDWINQVRDDLKYLDISLSPEDIKKLSKDQFRKIVQDRIDVKALEYLNCLKAKHSKVLHIQHQSLQLQQYFSPENVSNVQLSKFLFQARSRMLNLRGNFKQKYKKNDWNCELGCQIEESQEHLLFCEKLSDSAVSIQQVANYHDLFSNQLEKQLTVASILQERSVRRKKMIKQA